MPQPGPDAQPAPSLFEPITAHCFFGGCSHVVSTLTPDATHEEMERHYAMDHRRDLDALLPHVTIRAGVLS